MGKIALLCIDMQYFDAARGYGVFKDMQHCPISQQEADYYFNQLENIVLPNVQSIQAMFRQQGLEVIHIRIQSMTQDGRDRNLWHKKLGLHCAPGSKEAEFLPEVAPVGDEIVINKFSSGAFYTSNLNAVLRNLLITDLMVVGVYTHECVESVVRGAADRGYETTLVEDGCAATSDVLQKETVNSLKGRYCNVISTSQVHRFLQNRN